MAKFAVGDIVRLKSGSPDMIVTSTEGSFNTCGCIWNVKGKTQRDSFPEAALVLVKKDESADAQPS